MRPPETQAHTGPPFAQTHRVRAAFRALTWIGCLGLLTLTAAPALAQSTSSSIRLERADPPLEATVSPAPTSIALWFEQPIDARPDSATIEIISQTGERPAIGPTTVYQADPRHISAPVLASLEPGTYSAVWTVRLAGEPAMRSGAYGFRVGSARTPGAATESDAWPAPWAVIARFITLLGLALSLGGFAVSGIARWRGLDGTDDQRRRGVIFFGAILALIGTMVEPVIEALLTIPSPAVETFVRGYPPEWWLRAGAATGLVVVAALTLIARTASKLFGRLLWLVGVVLAAVALTSLSMASVTSRVGPPLPSAVLLMTLVQVVLVLWTGIALHASTTPLVPKRETSPLAPTNTGWLSFHSIWWLVVALAGFGLVLVSALGVLLVPGPGGLAGRPFSWVVLTLAVLLVVTLTLALIHQRNRHRRAGRGTAGLATISLIGVATLAMTVPPGKAADSASLAMVDLVAPIAVQVGGEPGLVHLLYQPATTGENAIAVWLANADGEIPTRSEQPAFTVELTSLHDLATPIRLEPIRDEASHVAITTSQLPSQGWWQAEVTVTLPSGKAERSDFFLVLPDPNVHGYGPESASSPAAEAVFERGLTTMTGLHQVRFSVAIGGGAGTFARSSIEINDGGDGSTRSYREQSASYESVIIGDRQWLRQGSQDWMERQAGTMFTPSEWGTTYTPATGFALGPVVELGGEPSQVVTFWLPRQENPRQEPAWYAWWVGTETGQVHREAMISTRHYMVYDFSGFNQPIEIDAPVPN